MGREEREQLRQLVQEAIGLADKAAAVLDGRERMDQAVRDDVAMLRARTQPVSRDERLAWRVVPLMRDDADVVVNLAAVRDRPDTSPEDLAALQWLRDVVGDAARTALPLSKARFFTGRKKLEPARVAAEKLPDLVARTRTFDFGDLLDRLSQEPPVSTLKVDQILESSLGFGRHFGAHEDGLELVPRGEFEELGTSVSALDRAVAHEQRYVEAARAAGEAVRAADVRRLVESMPLEALRPMTRGQLPLKPFMAAGINNVQALLDRGSSLVRIPGVGQQTARKVVGAASNLQQITREDTPVRIDVAARSTATTELLECLRRWDGARVTRGAALDLQRAAELRRLAGALGQQAQHLIVIPVDSLPAETLRTSMHAVIRRAAVVREAAPEGAGSGGVWEDFLSRPSDYFALLAELGFTTEDTKKAHGDLPEEVIEAVRAQDLLTDNLKASLRGYQSFAARFALVQDKVIIGDEMGLGKTVEALAVFAHLRSKGEQHFLVICPAAVVSNWIRETHHHTTLRAHRIHGQPYDRRNALRNWTRVGGVGVITYDLLAWAHSAGLVVDDVSCVVVDEAHYVKNPATKRGYYISPMIETAPRAVLMTGTPLENRVVEFRNLVGYLRPDLAHTASEYSAVQFRRKVAPVYLRRNQEDVLTELPELVEVDEWLGMSATDDHLYRSAVVEGNFAAMRRAALGSRDSEKLRRLREIVDEAEDNDRRVIVYSYFLDVLDLVAQELHGQVFGPLTGKVAAPRRQEMIDAFSAADHGAVLVSQIVAGGVGLNIQAASVVVICEPQLKPTTEAQAIARAHRMGQVHSVQVHRLLSEGCVDERVREILAQKRAIFDEFARVSDTADAAPESVDISEAEIAKQVVSAERIRILGVEPAPDSDPTTRGRNDG